MPACKQAMAVGLPAAVVAVSAWARRRFDVRGALVRHWPLVVVLSLGAIVRLWTELAYSALLTPDSWTYIKMAFEGSPAMFAPDRPLGYPLLLEPLSLWGTSLTTLTLAQHLAGLAVGVLVYSLLHRLDVPRWAATVATAVVVLDSWAVTLHEQTVMAETFFTLFLTGSAFLAVAAPQRPWLLGLSGVLLAAAAMTRTMGLFAVPVFVVYVLWALPAWRPRLAAIAGLAIPLLLYSGAQGVSTGYFGMTEGSGWFLYGRVASLTSCEAHQVPRATRPLCEVSGERGRARGFLETENYVFNAASPAHKLFGGGMHVGDAERRAYVNGLLRDWARAVIRARTRAYVSGVAAQFSTYLRPYQVGPSYLLTNPSEPFFAGFNANAREQKTYITALKAAHFPAYERDASAPGLLRAYQRWFVAPGWLLTGLSMLAVLVVAVGAVARRPLRHTKQTLFLLTSSLAILLGAVAFSNFQDRFVPSVLPLLITGVVLFLHSLVSAVRPRPLVAESPD